VGSSADRQVGEQGAHLAAQGDDLPGALRCHGAKEV
jgi:hypothetical protein